MHRERKRRRLIMFSLVMVLMLMIGGYAAFQSKLDIKGSTKVTTNWEVLITNVTPGTPTGNAENSKDENDNVILPTWDGLSASMSADLYEAGDSMEYIVTVTNRGNLDAVLDNIDEANAASNHSEAVIITYSGYAEKQKLRRNSSMDIKVKVEYNPSYTGGEVTGTSEISFSFKEASSKLDNNNNPVIENDTVISKDDKTITYDCEENGGTGNQTSIFDVGTPVDLSVQCTKEGYTFLGWNTDKNATSVISNNSSDHTTLNNKETDTTLYGIYQKIINVKYKNEQLDDMNNWNFIYPERFNITYDNDTNMNTIAMTGSGGWEDLYIPIETKVGIQYTISFDYDIVSDYIKYSTYDGIGFQAVTNVSSYDSSSTQLSIGYLPTLAGNGSKILTFTATTTKTYFNFNFGMADDGQTVNVKLGNIRVKEGNNDIVKNSDTCTIYNKTTSCDFAVPTAILNNYDLDNTYYELDGWYIGDTKIENPGSNHTYSDSTTVNAKITNLPVMMSGPNFQTKIDSVKSTITEIEFVDTDEVTPPSTINNTTSWDVSAKQNESVIAWLDGTKMYIGGKGGVTGNSDCSNLFKDFVNITSIEFNNIFDTVDVTTMQNMFNMYSVGTSQLTSLDVSSFDTSKVTNMSWMFGYNRNLVTLYGIEKFDTSKVTSMYAMFDNLRSLKEVDVSNFDTSKVSSFIYMFSECYNLVELNLTNFYTLGVNDMRQMFGYCSNLKTIYVSESFKTTNITYSSSMFINDTNLVGGNGTSYVDKNAIDTTTARDATYAKIDKPNQEGYFTDGSYPVIRNVSSVSTTNSITLTVDAWIPSGDVIETIEYSKDNGEHWVTQGDSSIADNIYTFTGLDANQSYPIEIRVTSNKGKVTTYRYRKYDKTTGTTIPTNDLLFWGDASNPNNTDTIFKNKVNGTDGTMYNFNKTSKSGYNGDELVFDGVDDYVNLGQYNFNNAQSYVMYIKGNDFSRAHRLFGNWQNAGGGLFYSRSGNIVYDVYDDNNNKWTTFASGKTINTNNYYTIIGTYDGNIARIYIDGVLDVTSDIITSIRNTSTYVAIGTNPPGVDDPANMNLKEALLYNRALTVSEVQEITNNFNQKYNGPMTNILTTPTYEEIGSNQIKITYPSGCGSEFTCSYTLDDNTNDNVVVPVNTNTVTVTYSSAGLITAEVVGTVNSQKNRTSSTYNLTWNNLYVASTGNDTTGYGTIDKPYATMNKAYQSAKSNPTSSTIYIMDDMTVSETTNLNSSKNITLTSCTKNGNTCSYSSNNSIIRGNSLTNYVIDETLGELTLENVTVDGNKVQATTALLMIRSSSSILNLNSNSIVTRGVNITDWAPAGLHLHSSPTLNINGGTISYNESGVSSHGQGGGVGGSGTVTMITGTISNNSSTNLAGGIILTRGSFTMYGGEISNNTAGSQGGGFIIGDTAGNLATCNIQGGTISNNTASGNGGGILVYGGSSLAISGGTISDNIANNAGGGIYANGSGTVTVSGTALIYNNKANGTSSSSGGGGIRLNDGKVLNIIGGTISENNTNYVGGGISAMNNCTITISGGKISENTARIYGGGIDLWETPMTMTGGIIENNNSSTGGGISVSGTSTFTLNGGKIRNNIGPSISIRNSASYTYISGVVCGGNPYNATYDVSGQTCPT